MPINTTPIYRTYDEFSERLDEICDEESSLTDSKTFGLKIENTPADLTSAQHLTCLDGTERQQRANSTCKTARRGATSKKLTEATATDTLQSYIYAGVGPRFLGWAFPVLELKEDDTWEEVEPAGPRYWKTPREKTDLRRWSPVREHLQGAFRGLVWRDSRYVPVITVDLDRHFAEVLSRTHTRKVLLAGRVLTKYFPTAMGYSLKWCVEVNPRNGSVKFFGWGDRPIRTENATEIGKEIHECLGQHDLLGPKGTLEVFPFNSPQILLPMRIDKTTIIEKGILRKCLRDKREWVDDKRKTVKYETYSVLSFQNWLQNGGHYCERTLLQSLQESCACLPDVTTTEEPVAITDTAPASVGETVNCEVRKWAYTGKRIDNPNSFERQHEALLQCCRRAKRVVSVDEAMAYIRQNNLYTGEWSKSLSKRRSRVRWILNHITKTFDASKCRGINHEIKIGKFNQWARHHVGSTGIRGRDIHDIDDFGNPVVRRSRVRVRWDLATVFLSILEHCLITSPNDDGSLPQARVEKIWDRLLADGLVDRKFCDKKWTAFAKWLEKRGIVKIVDRNWHRGKAMRWEASEELSRLHEWWRRSKKPSPFDAVPLTEFLADRNSVKQPALNSYSHKGGTEVANRPPIAGGLIRPPP